MPGAVALGLTSPYDRGTRQHGPEYEDWLYEKDAARAEAAAAQARGDNDRVQAFTLDGRSILTTTRANAAAKGLTLLTGDPARDGRTRERLMSEARVPGHEQEPGAPSVPRRVREGMRLAEEAARRNSEAARS